MRSLLSSLAILRLPTESWHDRVSGHPAGTATGRRHPDAVGLQLGATFSAMRETLSGRACLAGIDPPGVGHRGTAAPAAGPKRSRSPHEAYDHTGACKRWRLAAFLLFGSCHGERTGIAHVVPGGLDPAVGALDVRDAELVDMAVEGDRRCRSHAGRCRAQLSSDRWAAYRSSARRGCRSDRGAGCWCRRPCRRCRRCSPSCRSRACPRCRTAAGLSWQSTCEESSVQEAGVHSCDRGGLWKPFKGAL